MTLPYDIARCSGTDAPICQTCRRREPGDPVYQSYDNAVPSTPDECDFYRAPTDGAQEIER